MKILIYILCLYFIYLEAVPCLNEIHDFIHNHHTEATVNQCDNECNHSDDSCALFCTCSFCRILVIITHQFHLQSSFPLLNTNTNILNTELLSDYYHTIWQPPKK
jgi:hypothetical protein